MKNKTIIDKMKTYYDNRAIWHDEYMSYQGLELMEERLAPIIKLVEPYIANKSILEIACGTGNWTQVLAKRGMHITAIDSSEKSLIIAKKKIEKFKNISTICTDAYSLKSLDKKFDIVFAADWFSHIPKSQIDSFLGMLNKILEPNSHVIFIEMREIQYFLDEQNYIDDNGDRISKRELPDGSSYEVIKNFQTEGELLSIFSKFGNNVNYTEFDSLQRWIITYNTIK